MSPNFPRVALAFTATLLFIRTGVADIITSSFPPVILTAGALAAQESMDFDQNGVEDMLWSVERSANGAEESLLIRGFGPLGTRVVAAVENEPAGCDAALLPVGRAIGPDVVFWGQVWGDWSYRLSQVESGGSQGPISQGEWQDRRGYLGFSFETANGTHYGWLEMEDTGGHTLTIHGYAYEQIPGAPIAAGAVPEPEAFVLLLFGLALVGRTRRHLRWPGE